MKDWQRRVLAEKGELDLKYLRLVHFINAPDINVDEKSPFKQLRLPEQARLHCQCRVMKWYSDILEERIVAFRP